MSEETTEELTIIPADHAALSIGPEGKLTAHFPSTIGPDEPVPWYCMLVLYLIKAANDKDLMEKLAKEFDERFKEIEEEE